MSVMDHLLDEAREINEQANAILDEASALCVKFIRKCQTGKARSTETLGDCIDLLANIKKYKKENSDA